MIRNFIFCFVLLLSAPSFAQLPGFDLFPEQTPVICSDDGTITVTVGDTVADVTVTYELYQLPDEITPISTGVGNAGEPGYPFTFTGLSFGDYKVVAVQQDLNNDSSSEEEMVFVGLNLQSVTPATTSIENSIYCGDDGEITVELLQGVSGGYSLLMEQPEGSGTYVQIAGPQDAGEDTTVFSNLFAGNYIVVIEDDTCGGSVEIPTVITPFVIPAIEFVGDHLLVDTVNSDILVNQMIGVPAGVFPITVTFTYYPPDGSGPVVLTPQVIPFPGGDADPVLITVNENFPYYAQEYSYDVNVSSDCGISPYIYDLLDQPVEFGLNLVPTPEICFQDGEIEATISWITPGATVDYTLYQLPNDTTPIAFGTGNPLQPGYPFNFTGLVAGDYAVVVTQILGGNPIGSVVEIVTVPEGTNQVTPETTIISEHILCGDDGTITVTLEQGIAAHYILQMEQPAGSGTFVQVAGPQGAFETSTVFTGLFPGQYRVVILDAICNENTVMTWFINPLTIPPVEFGTPVLTPLLFDCDAAFVQVEQPMQVPLIAFPIEVTFTVYPPDFPTNPAVVVGPITVEDGAGDPSQIAVTALIPYYPGGEEYYFTVHVTNQCGSEVWGNSDDFAVFFDLEVSARLSEKICYGIDILVANGLEFFTVEFLDRDDWFNNGIETVINVGHISDEHPDNIVSAIVHPQPNDLEHPGPFPLNPEGGSGMVTYGIYDMYWLDADGNPIYVDEDGNIVTDPEDGEMVPVLVGQYVIKVTDACGFFGIFDSLIITDEIAEPNLTLVPRAPLPWLEDPHPDPNCPDLDCIPVGDVYINHILFFDWGEDQQGNQMTGPDNIGKIEIIDGPQIYKDFLECYTINPDTDLPYVLPLDITAWVGLPADQDPFPPFPNEVAYPTPPPPGVSRPIFHGLVGLGEYTFLITDICGNTWTMTEELEDFFAIPNTFTYDIAEGCDDYGSLHIIPNFDETVGFPVWTIVEDAPDDFYTDFAFLDDGTGVFDLVATTGSQCVIGDCGYWFFVPNNDPTLPGSWQMVIGELPKGEYKFKIKIGCAETDFDFEIKGYEQELTEFDMSQFCGNFSFEFAYTSNSSENWDAVYHLERCTKDNIEECEEGDWVLVPGYDDLTPEELNFGVTGNGFYRIVKYYQRFGNDLLMGTGPHLAWCKAVINEFGFFDEPGIKTIYDLSCPVGGNIAVIIDATGAEPLTYQLVTGDETPDGGGLNNIVVLFDNGHSNTLSLDDNGNPLFVPGQSYWFQIVDVCGASRVGKHTVGTPIELEVIEDNGCTGAENALCHGDYGCLSVGYISILDYAWYMVDENGVETPVLDENGNPVTGNQLHFNPFDTSQHTGLYRVYLTTPSSDLDFCDANFLEYLLEDESPSAGDDVNETYCHTDQSIDLSALLTEGANSGGTWTDVDNTGALNGSIFNTTGIANGTYTFQYEVSGCNGYDDAIISITLIDTPELPVIATVTPVCEGEEAELAIDSPNNQYTYTWTAPDGATYTGAVIYVQTEGTYTVIATLTGSDCASPPATASVVVNPIPDFAVTGNLVICLGAESTVLSVSGNNFSNSEATFEWTSDGAVIGTSSSIVVDDIGNYTVMVTLNDCHFSRTVTVVENTDMPDVVLERGCINNQFVVSVANTGDFPGATYQWMLDGGNISSESSINFVTLSLVEGTYMVTVTSTNGCSASETIAVDDTLCMIPKGISPNGDGINDFFDLSNFNVRELKIFNRYGRTVYEASNYVREWYGQSSNNDKLLPSSTYYYLVTLDDGSQRSGWVYLNREE